MCLTGLWTRRRRSSPDRSVLALGVLDGNRPRRGYLGHGAALELEELARALSFVALGLLLLAGAFAYQRFKPEEEGEGREEEVEAEVDQREPQASV